MRLLCALGLFLALLHVTSCLLIGAFNIQNFGPKKSKDKVVMETIKKIVQRYDIILIQGLQDKDLKVANKLLDLVNQGTTKFSYIVSEPRPLGLFSFFQDKERYLFLYRDKTVTSTGSFQYDGKGFMRPPFFVKFSSTETAVKEFVLIPIHTKPDNAVEEIDALVDVVEKAKLKWTNNNIMVLGDFNAGGKQVKAEDWKKIRLFDTNKNFHWLIEDGVDTTVSAKSSNTYDRIVVTTEMEKGVVAGSAAVFNFREEYDLRDKAEKVSDHFPVEVELKPQVAGPEPPEEPEEPEEPES